MQDSGELNEWMFSTILLTSQASLELELENKDIFDQSSIQTTALRKLSVSKQLFWVEWSCKRNEWLFWLNLFGSQPVTLKSTNTIHTNQGGLAYHEWNSCFASWRAPVLARLQGMTDIPTTRSQTQFEWVTTGWLAVILLKGYIFSGDIDEYFTPN